jgi:pyruvate ferredoxin oxidoreductase gamma subunit
LPEPYRALEVRWHGRGGQGAVTASIILAEAASYEGLYSQAFLGSALRGEGPRLEPIPASREHP